jgi:hypothetical protein
MFDAASVEEEEEEGVEYKTAEDEGEYKRYPWRRVW